MVTETADLAFLEAEEAEHFFAETACATPPAPGLSEDVVERVSRENLDPPWLRDLRYAALEASRGLSPPGDWAPEALRELDLDKLAYYHPLPEPASDDWEDLSDPVRRTFENLGVRADDEQFLGGLKAQFDSSIVFSRLDDQLRRQGIVFVDSITGLRDYPDLFRHAFGSVIRYDSNLFTALNTSVFSGGACLFIPPGVKVGFPLKTYFRMNAEGCGQFGRTLIILGEDAELTFMEGCSAARHASQSLHASVGEIIAHAGSSLQFITFQNWSHQVFNLAQVRAVAHANARVKFLDCNVGARLTMKYPSTILAGEGARGEMVSIGFATTGQHQDSGAKMLHRASGTRSSIVSKSISAGEGRASYRGLVDFAPHTRGCLNNTECDALLINSRSRTETYPAVTVSGSQNTAQHEAAVSKLSEEQIFYLRQRGIPENEAVSLVVNGFLNDLVRQFPIEYSLPLRRLVDLEMEGSVG